jgi:DHA1 family tetracycline resistance protein-like MFS transporter
MSTGAQEVARFSQPPRRAGRQAAFGFIFATAIMNALSFGLLVPVLPALLKSFVAGDTASAALWQTVFALTWGAVQFFSGPVLGMASDRYGRRPVLLLSTFGLGADFLLMAFAPNLGWLFLGRVLNGLTASSNSTANAYLADITAPADRARRFGMLGSAFSVGFIMGPVVGGLLGDVSLRLPFMVAAGMAMLNGLYGLFILPESLAPEHRAQRFAWRGANPLAGFGFLRRHGELTALAAMSFLFQMSMNVWPMVYVLYTQYRYHWSTGFIGLVMMVTSALSAAVQFGLVGRVVRTIGERGAVLFGALCGAIGMAVYGWAPNGVVYFIGTPFGILSGFLAPGLMGLMSQRVGSAEQGRLQGVNQSLQGVGSVIAPLVYGLSFSWALRHDAQLHQPGAPFYLSASALGAIFLLGLRYAYARPSLQPERP